MHIRQPEAPALVTVGEALVVDAEQVQDGGLEVVDVHAAVGDVVAEVVGFAVDVAGPGAAAGHPHGKATGMVVAAVVVVGEPALREAGTAEFAAPDDQRVFEQAALFEVDEERLRWPGRCFLPAWRCPRAGCRADPSRCGRAG